MRETLIAARKTLQLLKILLETCLRLIRDFRGDSQAVIERLEELRETRGAPVNSTAFQQAETPNSRLKGAGTALQSNILLPPHSTLEENTEFLVTCWWIYRTNGLFAAVIPG